MHYEVKHPCIQDKLAEVRKIETTHQNFRRLVTEITMLLSFKALENVSVEDVIVETPIQKANCKRICEEIVVIPILRAGMGMLNGVLSLVPSARVGFLGMFRNEETAEPESYYENIPAKSLEGLHLIIDPMLATGGSIIAAIDALKEKNIKKIIVICIVTCPEGLKTVSTKHPDIKIYTASIDSHLNDDKYIVPGLGDAGDRLYGTD